MKNYHALQALYVLEEINHHCVEIDFGYAFICAMASSELDLQQWMPMLFLDDNHHFSDERVASDFARVVLAIYQQVVECYQNNEPLPVMIEESKSTATNASLNFANGYLQALMLIDNMQLFQFQEDSPIAQLQQTTLLLLDKVASMETEDSQKLALFELLPSVNDIISLLPNLLASYGHQCLLVKDNE